MVPAAQRGRIQGAVVLLGHDRRRAGGIADGEGGEQTAERARDRGDERRGVETGGQRGGGEVGLPRDAGGGGQNGDGDEPGRAGDVVVHRRGPPRLLDRCRRERRGRERRD